jgi:hypothetical protein
LIDWPRRRGDRTVILPGAVNEPLAQSAIESVGSLARPESSELRSPSESLRKQDARLPASDMQRSLSRKARILDIAGDPALGHGPPWGKPARHAASNYVPPLGNGPARQGAQVSTIHSKPTTDRSITVSQSLLTGSGFGLVAPASVPFSIFISRIAEMRCWARPECQPGGGYSSV